VSRSDPFDLARFVDAQDGVFDIALAEIRRGRKSGHWMWFVFPQLAGLGRSAMAETYAIRSLAEAQAYLAHPVLGPRLRTSVETLQDLIGTNAQDVFGAVDALKLRSSLTLFAAASPAERLYAAALERWFGTPDERTLELLKAT
jgi:uncharacterized protein (DUF1810 family)